MIQVKVGQIRAGMRNMKISGTLKEVEKPVEMATRFGQAMLARAVLEDETGSVRLNLWRDQIDVAKAGDTEDALDAVVYALVGCEFLAGRAVAFGDQYSAIWVPRHG